MTILFLCPHAAAKSLIARALFERAAKARGLTVEVDSAGTEPDDGPMPEVVDLLATEGIDVSTHVPRRVTTMELTLATRVISLGCELGNLLPPGVVVEDWSDVPLPGQDLEGARRRIGERVTALVDDLQGARPAG